MRAGIFQSDSSGLDANQRLARLAAAIADCQLDLVVCPELFMSGYNVGEKLPQLAEPCDGIFSAKIAKLAVKRKTAIIYGYPEQADGKLYNSAVCIDASGQIIANQRKMILPPGFEAKYFSSGSDQVLFDLNGVRCAILICFDAEFPETARAAAQAGAQLLIVPTALLEEWRSVSFQMMPTRAFENGVWLAYANHAGRENDMTWLGASCIVSPDGKDAVRAGFDEELIFAEIDLAQIERARNKLPYLTDAKKLKGLL
jgi:5-aminopentanamidase